MTQTKFDKRRILNKSVDSNETNWTSIYIAAVLSFIGSTQFSLYFSALWPYLQILDHGTSESFFGLTIALYSLGQIITSPLFGMWSNKVKQVRQPLSAGFCLMFVGNLLYIAMETVHVFPKRYLLCVGRFITGAGSGNVAILRTYGSTASSDMDRSKALSFITCGQALGTVIGPVFQLLFTGFDHPGTRLFDTLSLSLYTLPAYLACFMNLGGLVLLYGLFRETYAGIIEEPSAAEDDRSSTASTTCSMPPKLPRYDRLAVFVCYATRFTDMFVRTNLEVLGSIFAMMMFSLTERDAVTVISVAQGCIGALTFAVYVSYIFLKLDRFIQLRNGCIISLAALVLFHLITYAWPFLPTNVELTSKLNGSDPAVGCNSDRFGWCGDLRAVNFWVFYCSYALIIGLSFPLLTITMNTLFSKVIGPRRQGTQQGFLQVSSGVARIISPLSASALYSSSGPRPVWIMEILVVTVTLSFWLLLYRRMVPLKVPEELVSPIYGATKHEDAMISSKTGDPKNKVHPV